MEITQSLYKQIYRRAIFYCYQDQDWAADATNKVILAYKTQFTAGTSTEEFWSYSNKILKNTAIDSFRRKALHDQPQSLDGFYNVKENNEEDSIGLMLEKLKEYATEEEIKALLEYYSFDNRRAHRDIKNNLKTNKERVDAHRLIKKIKERICHKD